jgi:hypothetical protein
MAAEIPHQLCEVSTSKNFRKYFTFFSVGIAFARKLTRRLSLVMPRAIEPYGVHMVKRKVKKATKSVHLKGP